MRVAQACGASPTFLIRACNSLLQMEEARAYLRHAGVLISQLATDGGGEGVSQTCRCAHFTACYRWRRLGRISDTQRARCRRGEITGGGGDITGRRGQLTVCAASTSSACMSPLRKSSKHVTTAGVHLADEGPT
eukprot:6656830-Pyramimonas_sp.AAC.1